MKFFTHQNLNNLILLKKLYNQKIIQTGEKKGKKSSHKDKNSNIFDDLEKNLSKSIHSTGIYLCSQDKLVNNEILNFIEEDKD